MQIIMAQKTVRITIYWWSVSSLATRFLFCGFHSLAAVGGAGGWSGDVGGDARPLAPPPMVSPFIYLLYRCRAPSLALAALPGRCGLASCLGCL